MSDQREQRCEVWYSGRVQGVGFRYTTQRIARKFGVTGYVQNLPDGRVYLVVEGLGEELDQFLKSVESSMTANIMDRTVNRTRPVGEFSAFDIKF